MYTEGLQIGHIQIVTKLYMYIQKYHDKSVLNKELNFHIPIKTGFGVIPLLRTIEANTKIKIKLLFQSPRIIKVYKKSITCMSTNITKKIKMINLIFCFRINVYDFLSVSIYAVCYFISLVVFVLW
jgi:hypothetical protein